MATESILILGTPRSGTTFLAKLFDSHPSVLYRHEPDSVVFDGEIPYLPKTGDSARYRDQVATYFRQLLAVRAPKTSGHRPVFDKAYRSNLGQTTFLAAVFGNKLLERSKIPFLSNGFSIPDMISANDRGRIVYLVKSVDSLCRARLFLDAVPECKLLILVRHPCGVIASLLRGAEQRHIGGPRPFLKSWFALEEAKKYPFTLAEMRDRPIAEQLAYGWMLMNQKVLDDLRTHSNHRTVVYEDLCRDPINMARSLFQFCDLSWNPQTEDFIANLKTRGTAGYFDVIRSPLDSIDKWRSYLSDEQIEGIRNVVRHAPVGRMFFSDPPLGTT